MMKTKMVNKQVEKAGYYFIGHFCAGQLRIVFDDCQITIPIAARRLIANVLWEVFGIDSENGVYFETIKDKYCRVEVDEETDETVALWHIVKNQKVILKEYIAE